MKITMKLLVWAFSLLMLVVAGTANAAVEQQWKGPGWYIYVINIVDVYVWKGPYADKSSCEKDLPSEHYKVESYSCEYVEHEDDF